MENLKKCNKCNQPMKVMNTLEGRNFCSECRDKYCFKGFTGEWYIAGWDEKINNYMPSASMVNKCSMNCKHKPEDLVRGKTFTLNCAECDKEIKLGATVILLTDYGDEKQLKQVEDKNKKICVSCWLAGKETKWANYCWIMQFDNIHEDSRNCSNRKVLRNISEPKQAKERERERVFQVKCNACGSKKTGNNAEDMNLKCEKCGSSEKMEVSQVSKRSWGPWIIGGSVLLAGIIGIAVYFGGKRGKKGDKADAS